MSLCWSQAKNTFVMSEQSQVVPLRWLFCNAWASHAITNYLLSKRKVKVSNVASRQAWGAISVFKNQSTALKDLRATWLYSLHQQAGSNQDASVTFLSIHLHVSMTHVYFPYLSKHHLKRGSHHLKHRLHYGQAKKYWMLSKKQCIEICFHKTRIEILFK